MTTAESAPSHILLAGPDGRLYEVPNDVAARHVVKPARLAQLVETARAVDPVEAGITDVTPAEVKATLEQGEAEVEGQSAGLVAAVIAIKVAFLIIRLLSRPRPLLPPRETLDD